MSYSAITNETITGSQSLTGFKLVTEEKNQANEVIQTVTTYFDAAMNEVGAKIENAAMSSTSIYLNVYADNAALVAGNYTEYGEFYVTDSSGVETERTSWTFNFASNSFTGGTEVIGTASEAQISVTYASDWSVASASASIGSGVTLASITDDTNDSADEWDGLPSSFKGSETTLYSSTDSDTGVTQYYSKDSSNNYTLVGTKESFTWTDPNNYTASGYNYISADGAYLGGGGRDKFFKWSNLREDVAASDDTTHGGIDYYVESGSHAEYDASDAIVYSESWEWSYKTSDGTFLGGKETRDGGTFVYDKDWNVVSSSKQLSSDVKSLGDSSAGIASLIDGTANTKDLDFSYYTSDAIISAIGKVFSAELKAASVTATDDYEGLGRS